LGFSSEYFDPALLGFGGSENVKPFEVFIIDTAG